MRRIPRWIMEAGDQHDLIGFGLHGFLHLLDRAAGVTGQPGIARLEIDAGQRLADGAGFGGDRAADLFGHAGWPAQEQGCKQQACQQCHQQEQARAGTGRAGEGIRHLGKSVDHSEGGSLRASSRACTPASQVR